MATGDNGELLTLSGLRSLIRASSASWSKGARRLLLVNGDPDQADQKPGEELRRHHERQHDPQSTGPSLALTASRQMGKSARLFIDIIADIAQSTQFIGRQVISVSAK